MSSAAQAVEVRKAQPVETLPLAPAASESAAILSVIERMATNPDIDPDRIERYMAMKERMDHAAAEKQFNIAMAEAQKEMGVVAANMANTQTKSRYADYAQLDRALRPIYTRHGFALSFNDGEGAPQDWVRIVCHVTNSGHTRIYHKDMPADGKGAKGGDVMTKTHAVGAAQSYAMRYLLRMIFNVAVGEADTDGNAPASTLSEDQVEELKALIDKAVEARPGTDAADWLTTFLEYMRADSINTIPAKQFGKAKSAIQNAIAAGAK